MQTTRNTHAHTHTHTHTHTHNTYDRIVVAGDVRANVVPNSTQVFLFDKEYGLTHDQVYHGMQANVISEI